ncbi:Ig-like domain-containing protein [Zafaria sp. J156]|nr:Ig-like domain-containing protein [Zafaria sp. J156]MEE1619998.1 Ig-like domain-containing protein [Zafaria sp. J156]
MSRWGAAPGKSTGFKAAAVTAATALAVTGAIIYPGFETADVDLNDGGVWVVNKTLNKVGHLNYQSQVLDGGVLTPLPNYDLAQEADRVFVRNLEQASLTTIDPAMVQFTDDNAMPANSTFSFGRDVVAVTDSERGIVYASRTEGLSGFAAEDGEPLLDAEGRVLAEVGTDGTVWVADLGADMFRGYTVAEDGTASPAGEKEVEGLSTLAEPQLTVVGDTAVVFDAASGDLLTSEGRRGSVVDPAGGRLQAPGPESDGVAVALGNKLAVAPLGGGEAAYLPLESNGTPIQPVRVAGCTYAAWQGSAQYVRDCDDDAHDDAAQIPGLDGSAELQFRVNRDVVVLNDVSSGQVWLVNEGMQVVNNWSDLEPPKGKGESTKEDSKEITDAIELPNRTEENKKPITKPDNFGVRAGRTTALPVLFNDVDPDGDLLVAKLEGKQPSIGTLQGIYNGTGFQLVVPEDASGSTSFTYMASDGRGGDTPGQVTVRVVPEDQNSAPVQERVTTLRVQQGGSVTQNVLTDWSDPDGDDLQLLGGASPDNDTIRVRPDGSLTYQDSGKTVGQKDVTIQVSDGREGTQGRIVVEVLAKSSIPPVPSTDHVVANVGEEITFSPLDNDSDPSGSGLRLASIDSVDGVDLAANTETGTVTLRGTRTGTFYAKYVATNGPSSAPGLVRIDIRDPESNTGNPVAVRDVALLPAGGDVLVNVLGNDTDPAGGVLVLTGTDVPEGAPYGVSVERNSFVRISDVRGLTDTSTVHYSVSNGTGVSTGEITVIPVPAPPRLDPPRPNPDTVVVRAGDVATVNVLDNDIHPNGAELTLRPQLKEADDIGEGSLVSVADETVRFRAGEFDGKPRQVSVVYTVAGPDGQEANARVTFQVQPQDLEKNAPPNPVQVEGRVFAGGTTVIDVPLGGIDPDGDSVSLVQLGTAPRLGNAVVRGGAIEYTAGQESSGTDAFSYVVEDRHGARATGTAMVGIAPLSTTNNPPVAANDSITVRPDRPVAVDVLANDSDPDGDRVTLVDDLSTSDGVDAEVSEGRIVVTSPPEKGSLSVRYKITDGRGGTASATLTVQSDPEAELLAPIARDDRASLQETVGKEEVTLAILENDEDPDGRISDLEITLPDNPATTRIVDRKLAVQVQANAQVVAYTITDVDGGSSTAFVHVPGSGEARPVLKSDTPLEVMAGEVLPLKLPELVQVRDGRSARVTAEDKVRAVPENQGPLVLSATELAFKSADDYAGPASVTVEVTDGTGPDDSDGLTAVLSIPVKVLPRPEENRPPTLQSNSMQIAQGEDAERLDLLASASDPDEGDLEKLVFKLLDSELPGIDVALVDGRYLTASAPAQTPKGTTGTVTVSVEDEDNPPVTATVAITVLASNRELPVAVDDVVADAHQGRTEIVDVLRNDHNPYAGEGDLTIVDAYNGGGGTGGDGGVEIRGRQLAITPGEAFVGTMTVQYTIGDITEDPDRYVTGNVTLNVKGRPEAPGLPRVESTGDRQAVLSWDAPANNGSPIEYYTVRGSGFEQRCESTSCTLAGLENDKTYNFTVTATNAVNESDPSAASADARPDVEPEQPAAPTTTYGDQQVAVQWTTPVSRGSAVSGYTLEISPSPANGVAQVTGITGTSYTWEGLTNGVSYQFRVQAVNKADKPSLWSSYSATVIPAGRPFQPTAPTAVRQESAVDGGVVNVNWSAPDDNGAPLQGYTLAVYEGSSLVRTIDGIGASTRSQTVTGLKTTGSYSFTVTARNKVGASPEGPRSTAVTPYGRPLASSRPTAVATGRNNEVRLNFTAPGSNGSPITGYQYSTDGGAWQSISGPGAVVSTNANGAAHTWRVRAVNAAGGGDPSPGSNSTSSYGAPRDGGGRSGSNGARGERSVTFNWNKNASAYDNGRATELSVSVNRGTLNASTGRVTGLDYDQQVTLTVRATTRLNSGDAASQTQTWTVSARAGAAPPPPNPPQREVILRKGPEYNGYAGCNRYCHKFDVEVKNFSSGRYQVQCHNSNGRFDGGGNYIQVGSSGDARAVMECVNGRGHALPVFAVVDGVQSNRVSNW